MEFSDAPVLDPRTQWFLKFLQEMKRLQVFELPLEEARAQFARGQEAFAIPKLPARIEEREIAVGPHGSVKLRMVRPEKSEVASKLSVVVFLHGGGWVLGDAETYDVFVRQIANGTGAAVAFVEYRRAPEARYPQPLEECYAATKWVAEHGPELGVDATRLVLAGDSAGGNLSASVCMLAKKRGGPKIGAQVLLYPATGPDMPTPSFRQFATGHFLTAEAARWFWRQYAPDRSADRDPLACPLLASLEDLKDLPPTLVITAECDILRDEGEAYARKLTEAGVAVTCTRYLGAIHGFMTINAVAETPAAQAAIAQMNGMLRYVLADKSKAGA